MVRCCNYRATSGHDDNISGNKITLSFSFGQIFSPKSAFAAKLFIGLRPRNLVQTECHEVHFNG